MKERSQAYEATFYAILIGLFGYDYFRDRNTTNLLFLMFFLLFLSLRLQHWLLIEEIQKINPKEEGK